MKNYLKISGIKLASLSMILWVLSLAFNGLALGYNGSKQLGGLEILGTGWLSPLVVNFAWFANIFFIYACLSLLYDKKVIKSAFIATFLCFDMFRMSVYSSSASGSTTVIYGYGWGAILWLLSIFLMLAAAGTRLKADGKDTEDYSVGVMMQRVGLALLTITILLTSYFAVHDRSIANEKELRNLTKVAFKRTKVCSTDVPTVIDPIKHFSGKLIVRSKGNILYARHPLFKGKDLLEWGIPYATISGGGVHGNVEDILSGDARSDAVLHVREVYSKFISAFLVEQKTGRVVFDFTWTRELYPQNNNHYCPDYRPWPKDNEQPRMVLMQGLGLSK